MRSEEMSLNKHVEDDSDLSFFINDQGQVGIVCSRGHNWLVSPIESTMSMRQLMRVTLVRMRIWKQRMIFATISLAPNGSFATPGRL